ncbi:MAG: thioesterase family protein [Parvibaculaceae bacterium]
MNADIEPERLESSRFSRSFNVLPDDTVSFINSSFPVLSTPALVRQVERACRIFLLENGGGQSVGAAIELVHSAPALLGSAISIEVQIDRVERRRVSFSYQVRDEIEMLASGKHTRVMIDLRKSGANLAKKAENLAGSRPNAGKDR